MKRMLFLWLAVCFAMSSLSAQTLINESFEGAYPPTGWVTYQTSTTGFTQTPNYAHSGSKSISYNESSTYHARILATPQITAGTGTTVSFWLQTGTFYGSSSYYHTYRIKVSTIDNAQASFTTTVKEFSTYNYSGICANNVILTSADIWNVWYECVTDLSAYAGQTIYVALEAYDHYGASTTYIDDIVISTPYQEDLSVLGITPYNVFTGQAQTPYVTIKNNGLNAVTSGSYTIELSDGASYSQILSGVALGVGADTTLAFPNYSTTTAGALALTATINYAADLYTGDNTLTMNGTVYDIPVYPNNAYTLNASNGNYYAFDIFTSTLTSVGTGISNTPFPMSETWVGLGTTGQGDGKIARVCEDGSFGYVLANGAFVKIGNLISPVEAEPVSLAYDRTNNILYVLGIDDANTAYLGTVDLTTLQVTAVGNTNNTQLLIGIDFADDGYLYGPALANDMLYKIDPTDATTTQVGSVGVNLNYGQDVAYDYVTHKLYSYAYVNSIGVRYGYYNLTTGAFVEIAPVTPTGQYASVTIISNVLPSCDQVTGLTSSEVTSSTATVSWLAPESGTPSNGYEYYLATSSAVPTADSIATGTASDTVVYLTDLTPNTTYFIWVRSNCGSDVSAWSNFYATFWTPCEAITMLPFVETFETSSVTRDCWRIIDNNGDGRAWNFYNNSSYAHEGSYSAQIYTDYNAGNNDDYLISPAITLSNASVLTYWYRARSTGEPDALEILVSTTGNQPSDFINTILPMTQFNNTTYQQRKLNLSTFIGETIYIAWHVPQGGPDGYYINIDDVVIREISSENDILTFSIPQQTGAAVIDANNHTVDLEVGYGTTLTALIPTISISQYATITPASGVAQDFSSMLTYTVMAEDSTTQDWYVNVYAAATASSAKDILAFGFSQSTAPAVIDNDNATINVTVNWQTSTVTALIPTITVSPFATVSPVSGVAQDFTNPVTYTVTAQDGTTKSYIVTVIVAAMPVVTVPYSQDFSLPTANADFTFYSDAVNKWTIGTATGNPANALYISNDNGVSNNYSHTTTHAGAFLIVNFADYTLSFDWKCLGESAAYDRMQVWVVPQSLTLPSTWSSSGNWISGTGATLIGNYYGNGGSWTHVNTAIPTSFANTTGKLVFLWYNDNGGGSAPAAAVDNIVINGTNCTAPINLHTENLTATNTDIVWTQNGTEIVSWNLKVHSSALTGDIAAQTANMFDGMVNTDPSQTITGLSPETQYFVYLQGICNDTETNWISMNFTTPATCALPTGLQAQIVNPDVTITWNALGMTGWNIKLSATSIDPTSAQGGIVNDVVSGTPEYIYSNYTAGQTIYYYIQSDCNGPWANGTFNFEYCTPSASIYGADGDGISNVTFGTAPIVNNTTGAEDDDYGNYSNLIGGIYEGMTDFTVAITYATGYTYGTKIWIDWNQNLVFDATELVYTGLSLLDNPTVLTATIPVPSGTLAGSYRMRIGGTDNDNGPTSPCVIGDYGCMEDYTLQIVPAPSCMFPTGLTANGVAATSATITWTAPVNAPASGYQILISDTLTTTPVENEAEIQPVADTFLLVTTLLPQTQYYVWIRSDCGGDYSPWVNIIFTTSCASITVLPWTENFDNLLYGQMPSCWTTFGSLLVQTSYPTSSPNTLRFNGQGTNIAVLPVFDADVNTTSINFVLRREAIGSTYESGTMDLGYLTDMTNANSFVAVQADILTTAETNTPFNINLSNFPAGIRNIAFRQTTTWNYWYWLDDVEVRYPSDANDILTLSFTEQTAPAVIDAVNHTVAVEVSYNTPSLTALVPTIAVSPYATISPLSGVAQDFSSPFTYTVTSELGTPQTWTVSVTQSATASSAKDIVTFTLPSQTVPATIDANAATVDINVNIMVNPAALTPTITVSPFATISPASGVAQDFTNPVTYTVTAENGTTKAWTITVTQDNIPLGAACGNPIPYTINDPEASVVVNATSRTLWFAVTLDNDYTNVVFSTCGTAYDTKLFVVNSDCSQLPTSNSGTTSGDYMYYNDDDYYNNYYCSSHNNQSVISASNPNVYPSGTYTGNFTAGTYYVVVTPYGSNTNISTNATLLVTGTAVSTCPAPTNVTASNITQTSAAITWTAGGSETAWQLQHKEATGSTWSASIPVSVSNYNLTGLSASQTYNVRVRAICGVGDTSVWSTHTFPTSAPGCSAPTALTPGALTQTTATITWTPGGSENQWALQWKPVSGSAWTDVPNLTAATHTLTGLTANTCYEVRVKAICGAGNESPWSTTYSNLCTQHCDKPANLHATNVTDHTITIEWQGGNALEWKISYTGEGAGTGSVNTANTAYTLIELADSTTYNICVTAVCGTVGSDSTCTTAITLKETGIHNITLSNGVKLYPNPASDQLTVTMENRFNTIEITNTLGQVIYRDNLTENKATIDVTGYSAGMYYVKLQGANGMVTKKFVKR